MRSREAAARCRERLENLSRPKEVGTGPVADAGQNFAGRTAAARPRRSWSTTTNRRSLCAKKKVPRPPEADHRPADYACPAAGYTTSLGVTAAFSEQNLPSRPGFGGRGRPLYTGRKRYSLENKLLKSWNS